MSTHLDYSTLFDRPRTLAVCVLIEGVPLVLVPAGVVATEAAVSSGSADALWWPGTGSLTQTIAGVDHDPVRAWLDPGAVWEVYKATDPAKGDAKVEALNFDIHDPAGAATALVSAPRGRTAQLLAASLTTASTSIPLDATAAVPSSGVAYVGREAIIYAGVGGGALGTLTRGAFGSRTRAHRFDDTAPPVVVCSPTSAPWPRYLYGRLATVFLCRLAGTTLIDPTPIFCGTVGPGVSRNGVRWSVPLDSVVEVLGRKVTTKSVTLFGINHLDGDLYDRSPLASSDVILGRESGSPDRDGWHPNMAAFVSDWNADADARGANVRAYLTGNRLQVRTTGLGADGYTVVNTCWDTGPDQPQADASGVALWTSRDAPPDTVCHLDGRIPLPLPGDSAKIPGTLSFSSGASRAVYVLRAETASGDELAAVITGTGSSGSIAYVEAYVDLGEATTQSERNRRTLVTERTVATLGVQAEGSGVDVLLAAALALDELDGGLHRDVIDWDQIARLLASVPLAAIPSQRVYRFGDRDTLVRVLSDELRLRGMALCTRHGRLAAFRTGVFAGTEETSAAITEVDILCQGPDADQAEPIEPQVIDSPTPVVTSVRFMLPGGGYYQWVDDTHRREFGDGDEMECNALASVPVGTDLSAVPGAIQQVAQQLLGVLAEPYRVVRVTLGPAFLGLQEGDLVSFTHPRVPTLTGTLGVTNATCQIEEVRTQVMGGRGRIEAALRLQEPDLAGYAPEVLVAAGGLTGGSAVVTIDTTSGWGATCFAREVRADGTAGDPLDGFSVGDLVVLSQIGTRTPIADESFTVAAIGSGTITLNTAPSAGMIAAATGQYGVILRFDTWTDIDTAGGAVATRQEKYLFIGDDSALDLGSGDPPKRWAA